MAVVAVALEAGVGKWGSVALAGLVSVTACALIPQMWRGRLGRMDDPWIGPHPLFRSRETWHRFLRAGPTISVASLAMSVGVLVPTVLADFGRPTSTGWRIYGAI